MYLPKGVSALNLPTETYSFGEMDYNDADADISFCTIPPYSWFDEVVTFVATAFTSGSSVSYTVGTTSAGTDILAGSDKQTMTSADGVVRSSSKSQTYSKGKYVGSTAQVIYLGWTHDADDTAGALGVIVKHVKAGDFSSGAFNPAIR